MTVNLWTLGDVDTAEEQLIELRWACQALLRIPEAGTAKDQADMICVRERIQELVNFSAGRTP